MRNNEKLFKRYVKIPLNLLIENSSIFVLILIFLVVNKVSGSLNNSKIVLNSHYIYTEGISYLLNLFSNWIFIIAIIIGFLVKTYIAVAIGQDLFLIFQIKRKSLINSLRQIQFSSLLWFFTAELIIWGLFTTIGILFYFFTYLLWKDFSFGEFSFYILLFFFILLFPIFYISFSVTSLITVLPFTSSKKCEKVLIFFQRRVAYKTYVFYFVRLTIENILIFIFPLVFLQIFHNYYLAIISSLFGLIIPFSLLRGSAYEFKLHLLEEDIDIKALFKSHFDLINKT